MAEKAQVYKCELCGNIVEVIHGEKPELVCCGQTMVLLLGKTEDQGVEKHLPVVESIECGVKVKVGDVPHPMEEKHYIEWIEVVTKNGYAAKFLCPGDKPEADLNVCLDDIVAVRENCTIHGMWIKTMT